MLKNRLKILLAERDLSIKDVVSATGLTRSALSNMVNHREATIATKNINKLLNLLGITPTEFWEYRPDKSYSDKHEKKDKTLESAQMLFNTFRSSGYSLSEIVKIARVILILAS